jgi:hypothetical protein
MMRPSVDLTASVRTRRDPCDQLAPAAQESRTTPIVGRSPPPHPVRIREWMALFALALHLGHV